MLVSHVSNACQLNVFLVAVARGSCRKAGIFVVLGSKHRFSGHPSGHAHFF